MAQELFDPPGRVDMRNNFGASLYRGVLVQWDEDHDERILDVIDNMPARVIDHLLVVAESEGSIGFLWEGEIPAGYSEWGEVEPPDGDCWSIWMSVAVHPIAEQRNLRSE